MMKKGKVESGSDRHGWKSAILWAVIFFVLLSLLLYFRRFDYNLYIANKAIASSAVILIGMSFLISSLERFWPDTWARKCYMQKYFGIVGFGVAVLHVIITFILLSPEQYSKIYTDAGTLNLIGQWSLLLGTLALFIFAVVAIASLPSVARSMSKRKWKIIEKLGYLALLFISIHLFLLKWNGWINLDNWLNGLPPGSLVPFVFIVIVFVMKFFEMMVGER
jgi:DMSO/TMAO reductase YedYZ heme-binding membrane subunit